MRRRPSVSPTEELWQEFQGRIVTDGKEGLGDLSELLGEKVGGVELHWVGGAGNLGGGSCSGQGEGRQLLRSFGTEWLSREGRGGGHQLTLQSRPPEFHHVCSGPRLCLGSGVFCIFCKSPLTRDAASVDACITTATSAPPPALPHIIPRAPRT